MADLTLALACGPRSTGYSTLRSGESDRAEIDGALIQLHQQAADTVKASLADLREFERKRRALSDALIAGQLHGKLQRYGMLEWVSSVAGEYQSWVPYFVGLGAVLTAFGGAMKWQYEIRKAKAEAKASPKVGASRCCCCPLI